jgi:integrase
MLTDASCRNASCPADKARIRLADAGGLYLEVAATGSKGWSENHAKHWLRAVEKDLFPWVGAVPLGELTAPLLLQAIRKVEARGATQMAHDLRGSAGQVFKFGIATGRCTSNPAADLRGALVAHNVKHMAAILEPAQVGELLRGFDGYTGQPATRLTLPWRRRGGAQELV